MLWASPILSLSLVTTLWLSFCHHCFTDGKRAQRSSAPFWGSHSKSVEGPGFESRSVFLQSPLSFHSIKLPQSPTLPLLKDSPDLGVHLDPHPWVHIGLFLPLPPSSCHGHTGTALPNLGERFCLMGMSPPVTTKLLTIFLLANVPNMWRYLFSSNPFSMVPTATCLLKEFF